VVRIRERGALTCDAVLDAHSAGLVTPATVKHGGVVGEIPSVVDVRADTVTASGCLSATIRAASAAVGVAEIQIDTVARTAGGIEEALIHTGVATTSAVVEVVCTSKLRGPLQVDTGTLTTLNTIAAVISAGPTIVWILDGGDHAGIVDRAVAIVVQLVAELYVARWLDALVCGCVQVGHIVLQSRPRQTHEVVLADAVDTVVAVSIALVVIGAGHSTVFVGSTAFGDTRHTGRTIGGAVTSPTLKGAEPADSKYVWSR